MLRIPRGKMELAIIGSTLLHSFTVRIFNNDAFMFALFFFLLTRAGNKLSIVRVYLILSLSVANISRYLVVPRVHGGHSLVLVASRYTRRSTRFLLVSYCSPIFSLARAQPIKRQATDWNLCKRNATRIGYHTTGEFFNINFFLW